ncbi:MAG: zinc-binding dehydrogenase, partial [Caulobacteraceae bacterium]|nr:zinc-binding dehydrogenase [Caulobacter sp.]
EVFATAGSPDKCAFCRTLGADHAIDYKREDFVDRIKALTDKAGVNLILDMVGGSYLPRNIQVMAMEGRLVQIAFLGSPVTEKLDFTAVMIRRLVLTGSTLRARTLAQKAAVADGLRERVVPLLEAGTAKPIVHATFPLEEARQAHEMMESSAHLGKIVLVTGK